MRVLKIDSDLIKIAAIEMLKSVIVSFNDISILNPMYLMTIEFIETALK
jgi:hypothetical protein